mgnify:FL=1
MDRDYAEHKVVELIEKIGRVVHRGNLSSGNPLEMELSLRPEHLITAVLYERFNNTWILRLELPLGKLPLRIGDRGDALDYFRLIPFATVHFVDVVEPESNDLDLEHTNVTLMHSVALRSLNANLLEEIADSLAHHATGLTDYLSELDANHQAMAEAFEALAADCESDSSQLAPNANVIEATSDIESALKELRALIGLESVKTFVDSLVAQQRMASRRLAQGLPAVVPSPHLVFTGNPGTGKTTVARLIGRIYKHFGLLKKGHVVEATRSDLCGVYVGQTGPKTRELCESAKDGVLFIDEAYTLGGGTRNDYGPEAIAELLTYMEANRGRIAIVVAGYTAEMAEFIGSNPGLKSRFDLTVEFPDFNTGELVEIFETLAKSNGYRVEGDAREALIGMIDGLPRGHGFGNAREIRRMFGAAVNLHAQAAEADAELAIDLITVDHLPEVRGKNKVSRPVAAAGWNGYV